MSISAINLRSAAGNINVALGQFHGIRSGTCKDTPERWVEIEELLAKSAALLQGDAAFVEKGQTPVIREVDDKGDVVWEGSVAYSLAGRGS